MKKFKGIIFDLDGTLLDSMGIWEKVDSIFLAEHGITSSPDVSDAVRKMTIEDSAKYFKTRFSLDCSGEEIIDRIECIAADMYRYGISLKDGVYDAVTGFSKQGIKMCVATATYKSLAVSALIRLGLYDKFNFILTTQEAGFGKDKPEIFRMAAERLGLDIFETVVLEDSLHCIQAASSGGFFTAAVFDKASAGEWDQICEKADVAVNSVSEFYNMWEK